MRAQARPKVGGAIASGVACGWNLTDVGAVATPLAHAYGTSLTTVGLLGAALWLCHAVVQAHAGRLADRWGARHVALLGLATLAAANALALVAAEPAPVFVLRAITGLGCGAVAVSASLRARPLGVRGQGLIGGALAAGAALAVATGPALEQAIGWRAPYAGGLVLATVLAAPSARRDRGHEAVGRAREPADLRGSYGDLLRLASGLACSIVLSFALANWITTILDRSGGFGPVLAGAAGALVVGGSVVTRPLGGVLAARWSSAAGHVVRLSLLAAAAASLTLALSDARGVVVLAMLVLGLAAGLPFASVVHVGASAFPHCPGAAVGFVGTAGTLAGVATIPLLGAAVAHGATRVAFATLAGCAVASAVALWHLPEPVAVHNAADAPHAFRGAV